MKTIFKKSILLLILFSFFFILGCGGSEKTNEVVEVNMWVMPNSLEPVNDLVNVLEEFHKNNPNIKVNVTSLDWGAAWVKITTAAISGNAPDIVQLGSTWVAIISSMGALDNLNDRFAQDFTPSDFLPAAFRTAGIEGSGIITSVPWFVDSRAMYYRTDVFNRLGISPLELDTWEGFEKVLKKIKDANISIDGQKVYPLGIPGKNDWNVVHNPSPWIWAAGGDYLKANNGKVVSGLGSPESASGLAFYLSLVDKGYVEPTCVEQNTSQIENDFNTGKYAIIFSGSNELRGLVTPPEQGGAADTYVAKRFGIAPYPAGPTGRYTFIGGSNLALFKTSKKKDAAWEVIKYLVSKKPQVEYSKKSGFMPSLMESFEDPYFTKDTRRVVFKEAVQYGRTYPSIPEWGRIEEALRRRFGIIWEESTKVKGGVNPESVAELLKVADKEINQILRVE